MADIIIHEVGPRDGLQAEKQSVPTAKKLEWIRALDGAGVDIVQIGSFVHKEKVAQMADTDELFGILAKEEHKAVYSGLALNEKGVERGLACGVQMFCLGVSASDTHSYKNTRMSAEDALRRVVAIAKEVLASGARVQVSVQSAFGCGFEGRVPEERVYRMVGSYLEAGLTNISLADTAGHAHPAQVRRMFSAIHDLSPDIHCTCHFHDTYGLGMANVYAALESGVTSFETSFAGLGGCPFTKVVAGNVATEDLVHSFQRTGSCKEINLSELVNVAQEVSNYFGREMTGRVHKSGFLSY
ncbi:hydroxymethylglutaryl-CoA lyase [candidate division GN15 bacterium]|nr:hydroxymethylglutaryl-CoA lyase [candidate division GN15 bacterium]